MNSKTFRAENMLEALELVKRLTWVLKRLFCLSAKYLDGPAWQVWKKPTC